jgi:hypothetical protein
MQMLETDNVPGMKVNEDFRSNNADRDIDNSPILKIINNYRNVISKYRRSLQDADKKLISLQNFTEDIFMKIGIKLPAIVNELNASEDQANQLLDYFKHESGFLLNTADIYGGDLARLKNASEYLIETVKRQDEAFAEMNTMMQRIEHIKKSIESVRAFSVEMEMLSINATIVAIKAGDAGRTLNPITAELNKMANATIANIDSIVNTSNILSEHYDSYQILSKNQESLCRNAIENTNRLMSVEFKAFSDNISALCNRLEQTIGILGRSREPVGGIMSGLQVQDIVKQCTDHVRNSLKRAGKAEIPGEDPEQFLDVLYFQEKVPMLCIRLLGDINTRLAESTNNLFENLSTIDVITKEIASSANADAGQDANENIIEIGTEKSFDHIQIIAVGMAKVVSDISSSWEQLWSTLVGLENLLKSLEEQLMHLKKVTNFHLVNIPIKIEVARNSSLEKDSDLSKRVDSLSEYIATEMKNARKTLARDYDFLAKMLETIGKRKNEMEMSIELIASDIEKMLDNFTEARRKAEKTFVYIRSRMADMSGLAAATAKDLDMIRELIEQNEDIQNDFGTLANLIAGIREETMSVVGEYDWTLRDSSLKEIVEKFTLLSHKQIAGSICDIEVEDGNQEGELILF